MKVQGLGDQATFANSERQRPVDEVRPVKLFSEVASNYLRVMLSNGNSTTKKLALGVWTNAEARPLKGSNVNITIHFTAQGPLIRADLKHVSSLSLYTFLCPNLGPGDLTLVKLEQAGVENVFSAYRITIDQFHQNNYNI